MYIKFTVVQLDSSSRAIIDTLEGSNKVGRNRYRLSKTVTNFKNKGISKNATFALREKIRRYGDEKEKGRNEKKKRNVNSRKELFPETARKIRDVCTIRGRTHVCRITTMYNAHTHDRHTIPLSKVSLVCSRIWRAADWDFRSRQVLWITHGTPLS